MAVLIFITSGIGITTQLGTVSRTPKNIQNQYKLASRTIETPYNARSDLDQSFTTDMRSAVPIINFMPLIRQQNTLEHNYMEKLN